MLIPIAFTLLNLALLPIFLLLIRRAPLWASLVFLAALIPESIFVALHTLTSFGGAFGSGMLAFCAAALMVPFVFVGWLIFRPRLIPQMDSARKVMYGMGGMLILLVQTAPIIGIYGWVVTVTLQPQIMVDLSSTPSSNIRKNMVTIRPMWPAWFQIIYPRARSIIV